MGWGTIGGNPAPGDPDTIQKVGVNECRRISEAAGAARSDLVGIRDGLSDAIWRGSSADEFGRSLPTLLDDLDRVHRSYWDAGDALDEYARKLIEEQPVARRARDRAGDAQRRIAKYEYARDTAIVRRNAVSGELDGVNHDLATQDSQLRELVRERLVYEQQANATTDPTLKATYQVSASNLSSQANQVAAARDALKQQAYSLQTRLSAAEDDIGQADSSLSQAKSDNRKAQKTANAVRDNVKRAGDIAADAVRTAKGTASGSSWDKFRHRVRESKVFQEVLAFVDGVSEALGTCSFLLTLTLLIPGVNVFAFSAFVLTAQAWAMAGNLALHLFDGRSSGMTYLLMGVEVALAFTGAKALRRMAKVGINRGVFTKKSIANRFDFAFHNVTVRSVPGEGYGARITARMILKSWVTRSTGASAGIPSLTTRQVFNCVYTKAGVARIEHAAVDEARDFIVGKLKEAEDVPDMPTIDILRARLRSILLVPDGVSYAY